MTLPVIVVGTENGEITGVSNGSPYPFLQKADSAGNSYPLGNNKTKFNVNCSGILGIALDAAGNTYAGFMLKAYYPSDYFYYHVKTPDDLITIRKIDPYGNTVWGIHHGHTVLSVCLDDANNVYIYGHGVRPDGTLRTIRTQSAITTRKYDNNGNLIWSADHGFATPYHPFLNNNCQMVYKNGYIYTGSSNDPSDLPNVTKYNAATGAIVWRTCAGRQTSVRAICVDDDDNVYVAGVVYGEESYNLALQKHLMKYNSSGTFVSSATIITDWDMIETTGINYTSIVINSNNEIIASPVNGTVESLGTQVYNRWFDKYDLDLTFIGYFGTHDTGEASIDRIAIDDDDYLYLQMNEGRSYGPAYCNLRKHDAVTLEKIWQIPIYDNYDIELYNNYSISMAISCIAVRNIEYPPLPPFKLNLGIPTVPINNISPGGLLIGFYFGSPNLLREYSGVALPNVYRAYLSGVLDYECLASSFQIRKTANSQSLEIVVPLLSLSQVTEIESRIGNNLTLYRGVKLFSGIEQLETMVAVTFDSVRYDYGSKSGNLTLSGNGFLMTEYIKTRSITGISYRNSINGRRRIRAKIDTYLQPGDTADLGGGETLQVSEVTIYANEKSAMMEFTE